MNRRAVLAVAGALSGMALLMGGCAQSPGAGTDDTEAPGEPAADSTAVGLVNLWRVTGAAGEAADTWLRLDVPDFQLWRDCGIIDGEWRATDSLFLASVGGSSGSCVVDGAIPEIPWLEAVTGYEAAGAGWVLTGADGAVLASLSIDGKPEAIPTAADFFTEPPTVTPEARAALARPAPLPEGATPAAAADLTGRWVPASFSGATDPHVVFEADGSWSGSDGCNGNSGRWAADGTGDLLATSGMSTLMACEGAPVPSWLAQVRLATLDDGGLRLLDGDAEELGRLERG
jgi:heat shock protein HslJ